MSIMNQSSHDGTRTHTPLKVQPQGRSEALEGGDKQNLSATEQQLALQRITANQGDQSLTHKSSRGIDNYSSVQMENSNIMQPISMPGRSTVGEHLEVMEAKQKHVRSRTETNKQQLFGNMTEFLEGGPNNVLDHYNAYSNLQAADAGVLRNKSNIHYNERTKSPDPRFSQGATENHQCAKVVGSIKSTDELYDERQYIEGEEENMNPPLYQSNGDGRMYNNAYNSHTSSIEILLQQGKPNLYMPQQINSDPRTQIEERLKILEQKLSDMEVRNQGFNEKSKTQTEFEKLLLELNQAKLDTSALGGEKRDDKEMALKNEIKFLINKLLQTKNKLEKQNEDAFSNSQQNFKRRPSLENTSLLNVTANQTANNISVISSLGGQYSNQLINTSQRSAPVQYLSYLNYRDNRSPLHQRASIEDQSAKLNKSSLGEAIENFSKNIRNKSNLKPQPQYAAATHAANYGSLSKTINRAKTPSLIRPSGGTLASKMQNTTNTSMMNSSTAWNRRNL